MKSKTKVLIAPDSFKGSLTAEEAADSIEIGLSKRNQNIDIIKFPIADGGEGTVDALLRIFGGEKVHIKSLDPLFRNIDTYFGFNSKTETAFIELANSTGMNLLKENELNPLKTSTHGTGLVIREALNFNPKEIIFGIGGSSTNDAGIGIANALGIEFYDTNNTQIHKPTGEHLNIIKKISTTNIDKRIKNITIKVLTDVKNPLLGKRGSAKVFASQKGASPKEIEQLENGMKNFVNIINAVYQTDAESDKGSGAAGGVGYGMKIFFNAELINGIDYLNNHSNLIDLIRWSDIIITGEGKIDDQSNMGKVVGKMIELSEKYDKKLIGIAGEIQINSSLEKYFSQLISIKKIEKSREVSINKASELLQEVASKINF